MTNPPVTAPDAAALEAARQQGITEERQRIADCRAIPALGHQALVDSMIAEGKTPADINAAIISAEHSLRLAAGAALEAEAPPVVPAVDSEGTGAAATMKRADFNALSPAGQRSVLGSGTKIVD